MARTAASSPPTEGGVLVRVPVADASWPARLPALPAGRTVTVTLGHPRLLPPEELTIAGYRIVGTAPADRPIGDIVDVLVPRALRDADPAWWEALAARAARVFDLRFGPVQRVLAAELELHQRAAADALDDDWA